MVTSAGIFINGYARIRKYPLDTQYVFRGIVFTLLLLAPLAYIGWSTPRLHMSFGGWVPRDLEPLQECLESGCSEERLTDIQSKFNCTANNCGGSDECSLASCADILARGVNATRNQVVGLHGIFTIERMMGEGKNSSSLPLAHVMTQFNM